MHSLKTHCLHFASFILLPLSLLSTESASQMHSLRTFENPAEAPQWPAQNDGVIGGVSSGKSEMLDGHLHFSGVLSSENNGGFAQERFLESMI